MHQRTFLGALIVVVICVAILLVSNLTVIFSGNDKIPMIPREDVKGVAIEYKKNLYTLSFDQQNRFLELVNYSSKAKESDKKLVQQKVDFQKLLVYRFKNPTLEITPIAYVNDQLLFILSGNVYKEENPGQLKALLSQTYDH